MTLPCRLADRALGHTNFGEGRCRHGGRSSDAKVQCSCTSRHSCRHERTTVQGKLPHRLELPTFSNRLLYLLSRGTCPTMYIGPAAARKGNEASSQHLLYLQLLHWTRKNVEPRTQWSESSQAAAELRARAGWKFPGRVASGGSFFFSSVRASPSARGVHCSIAAPASKALCLCGCGIIHLVLFLSVWPSRSSFPLPHLRLPGQPSPRPPCPIVCPPRRRVRLQPFILTHRPLHSGIAYQHGRLRTRRLCTPSQASRWS